MKVKGFCFIFAILLVWNCFSLNTNAGSNTENHSGNDDNMQIASGVEWIVDLEEEDIYVAEDLDYTITMEEVVMDEEPYGFFVYYPQIHFKDGSSAEDINNLLKEKACYSMDSMYPEFKYNKEADYGDYRSTVTYEISYMDNDLFSVIFHDEYFLGSIYAQFSDIRSCVIDLDTKQEYKLEDVIEKDDTLTSIVYEKMLEKSSNLKDAKNFNEDIVRRLIEAGETEDRYFCDIVLLADKIGIAFTYHYGDGNLILRGNTIVELEQEEFSDCLAESPMWEKYFLTDTYDDGEKNLPKIEDEYIVKKGDCLYSIAREQLGEGKKYIQIMEWNGLTSTIIYPGQKLRLFQY